VNGFACPRQDTQTGALPAAKCRKLHRHRVQDRLEPSSSKFLAQVHLPVLVGCVEYRAGERGRARREEAQDLAMVVAGGTKIEAEAIYSSDQRFNDSVHRYGSVLTYTYTLPLTYTLTSEPARIV
jgi:hypothetical protein